MGAGEQPVTTWTVLFTDVVASTELRVRVGETAFDRIRSDLDRLIDGVVSAHAGAIVKSTGDGIMARFAGTAAAVQCAVAVQQAIAARNRSAGTEPVALRIGVSVGDAVPEDGDLHGTAVVEAARLCAAAEGGSILCTDAVRAVSANRSGCAFSDSRVLSLKGLPEPVVVHEVVWAPALAAGSDGLSFGVLGSFEVRDSTGAPVAIGGHKEQLVLALLLLHANETVSMDSLVDALWGEHPPRTAERTVHAYVARLRRALEPEGRRGRESTAVVTIGHGYRLVVEPAQVDARRFEAGATEGAQLLQVGDTARAADAFAAALAEWRGDAYATFAAADSCAAEAARLTELRLLTTEQRVELDLANGRAAELVVELEGLVRDHPFRERLWGQLMLALYRAGRQGDALDAYQRARDVLVGELGLEPGPDLRRLEAAVLAQDPSLDVAARRAPAADLSRLPLALDAVGPAFVGRDAEAARLRRAWDAAASGSGSFVAVVGPEGAGKTRLVAHLARGVHDGGGVVLYGRCDHAHRGATAVVDVALRGAGGSIADVDRADGDLAGAVARHLSSWSGGRPVLLALDDLHVADAETLEFVAGLAGWCQAAPLLVIGAFRSDGGGAGVGATDRGEQAQIVLGPLDDESVGRICELYDPDGWSSSDIRHVAEVTGGVPLLVHEQASAWARDRASRRVEDAAGRVAATRGRLVASRGELADGVEGIQQLLEQRRVQLAGREAQVKQERVASLAACPYKGLARFEPSDAANFFGRERLVAELVGRLAESNVLAVVGPSGSGKSSLVRAGLLPALADGVLAGETWQIVAMCPGAAPSAELTTRLAGVDQSRPLAVFVDQFEEVFTLDVDVTEQTAFVDRVLALAFAQKTAVVLALRADHLASCTTLPALADALAGNDVLVGPMQPAELRRTIELPAQRAGLEVEPGLAEVIIGDVAGRAGALPLLSTALAETWERRRDRTLTVAGYRDAGGVNGALARLAEAAYAAIPEPSRRAARRILMRLCEADDQGGFELRRRLPITDVVDADDRDGHAALDAMADRRLLSLDDGVVEVAHEALLREWPRLRTWLEEDVQGRRVHARLAAAARSWEASGHDPSELYRGTRLGAASEWASGHAPELNRVEAAFLAASQAEAEREVAELEARAAERARSNRRLRRFLAVTAVLLVAALMAAATAAVQTGRARDARDDVAAQGREAALQNLAAVSDLLRSTDRDLAALLALAAYDLDPRPESFGALLSTFTAEPSLERSVHLDVETVQENAAIMPGGAAAVVVGPDFAVSLVDVDTGATTASFPPVVPGAYVTMPAPFADGRAIALAASSDDVEALTVWDLETDAARFAPVELGTIIGSLAVSPDGTLIAVAGGRVGVTEVRSAHDGSLVASVPGLYRPPNTVYNVNTTAVAFLPDGRLAIGTASGFLRLVDPLTGAELQRIAGPREAASARIMATADGHHVYGWGPRGAVAWDLDARSEVWDVPDVINCNSQVLVESMGVLLCGGDDGNVAAVHLDTGAVEPLGLRFQSGGASGLGLTADGGTLVQVGSASVNQWSLDGDGAIRRHLELDGDQFVQELIGSNAMLVSTRAVAGSVGGRWPPIVRSDLDTDLIDDTGEVVDPLEHVLLATRVAEEPTQLAAIFDDAGPLASGGRYDMVARARVPNAEGATNFEFTGSVSVNGRIILFNDSGLRGVDLTGEVDPVATIPDLRSVVASVDGSRLFTLEPTGLVQRTPSGDPTGREPLPGVRAAATTAELLVIVFADGRLQVLDAETLEPSGAAFPGSFDLANILTLADDGQRLLIDNEDFTFQLADLRSRTLLGDPIVPGIEFVPGTPGLRALLAPDGQRVAYQLNNGVVVWDLHPDVLEAAACAVAGRDLTAEEWDTYVGGLAPQRPLCPA